LELSDYFHKLISVKKLPHPRTPEGFALGLEHPGPLPCYATGPTLGTSAHIENLFYLQ